MSLEDILTAQLQATKESNALLRQLLEANCADLVKLPEAERRLGMDRSTINRRIAEGVYTAYRDGRNTRVSLSEIRQRMKEEGQ